LGWEAYLFLGPAQLPVSSVVVRMPRADTAEHTGASPGHGHGFLEAVRALLWGGKTPAEVYDLWRAAGGNSYGVAIENRIFGLPGVGFRDHGAVGVELAGSGHVSARVEK
jgi:hypothetical protein